MGSFGGQNVMQLMRSDMGSSNALAAMLASCNAQMGYQVPRSGHGGLEDIALVGCGQKRPFYPTFGDSPLEEMEDDVFGDTDLSHPVEKKRRLSFDQVRSLERSFEVENKLEPERKMQLARELNLQPRQVAVWFQNRRARWKIKQLERDYEMLNSAYTQLQADLESALREKDALSAEVQRLSGTASPQRSPKRVDSAQCEAHCSAEPAGPSRQAKSVPTIEVCEKSKEEAATTTPVKEQATASSGSNESSLELLDSDSPRTVDSNHLCSREEGEGQLQLFPSPESLVGPVDDSAKLELGSCGLPADPNCNYFLPSMVVQPEQGVLPWWDQWA